MNGSFPFNDAPNTACFTCIHCKEQHKPVLYISHDEDGYWQFLCGKNHKECEARIVSLASMLDSCPEIEDLACLDSGCFAVANNKYSHWVIRKD